VLAEIDGTPIKPLAAHFGGTRCSMRGCSHYRRRRLIPSPVGDLLRLTLLAPDIIAMILDGASRRRFSLNPCAKSLPLAREAKCRAIAARDDLLCGSSIA
jgi:hypothetical protein